MSANSNLLILTAAIIGFIHTLAGPDHYLPFIMMAKAKKWSHLKTAIVTVACGIGHVASSVILGLIGIAFGIALHKLKLIESFRGNIAAWALTAFGFTYMIWGIWKALKNISHAHPHIHEDGAEHRHEHSHALSHSHLHESGKINITPWILFTIFVFGPCEPLIPILMYPAATENIGSLLPVILIFSIATIGTMLAMVYLSLFGLNRIRLRMFERYSHAIAGGAIFLSGFAILFLRL
ncbi:MAG: sulfite exporter TauE/SafE family protein [Deltaproteobacteria bacterium]|nr:sulfite exporter TauE/SafE family protein [Deltaproteobacteria bacterium]MBI2342102.1 sulfite exporter TauE/SafE family protein [Deltaproteobacteria bacterium]